MDFIDLAAQQRRIKAGLSAAIEAVLTHGKYILGPEVRELERQLAGYAGVEHCVSCANGTDALVLALRALDVGAGDEVLVPAFSFFASAEAVALVGARPVFVDIEPRSYNLALNSLVEQYRRHPRARALIAVDLFGQLAAYPEITAFCQQHGLYLIEDAAQSFGATGFGGRACSFGDIATTSFFPAKPLGCYGDGGALFCRDARLAAKLESLRVHGQGSDKYHNDHVGLNSRLDSIQAAVLLEKLKIFPEELTLRAQVAERYHQLLQGAELELPVLGAGLTSSWAQYTLASEHRDQLCAALQAAGIPTAIYYQRSLHQQPAFAYLAIDYSLPVCERLQDRVFSLPMHPYLSGAEQERICSVLLQALQNC